MKGKRMGQKFKGLLAIAVALMAFGALQARAQAPAAGAAAPLVEGKSYQRLTPAQPTSSETGQIEVAEIFMYSCPACYAFEPMITKWRATISGNVRFIRIPASFNPTAVLHARAFYTAETLGINDKIDAAFFDEFHQKRHPLDSEDALAEFFGKFGVDDKTFRSTFNSFAVHTKVQRADELIKRYRVPGTPAIVVNGKYLTNGQMAGSYDAWFRTVDELVATEQKAGN
jgi:thiol:disulfide interchange protein DsbA